MRSIPTLILALASVSCVLGAPFTAGNILVSEGAYGPNPFSVGEYTRSGALVQRVSVPRLSGQDDSDYNRGMAIDAKGRLLVYNGTFSAGLSVYDPSTDSWENHLIPQLSIFNNGTYGKIATKGKYAFMPDHRTGEDTEEGIVRVNLDDGSYQRFGADWYQSQDLNIGPDGLLYSLAGAGSPSGLEVHVFDPETLVRVRTISLWDLAYSPGGGIVRDLIPRADGKLWANQMYSPTFLLDSSGKKLETYAFTQSSYVDDFDVAEDGSLLQVNFDGRVQLYDSSFSLTSEFGTSGYYYSQSFGMFVPEAVPEPATVVAMLAGFAGLARRRRSRK